MGNYACFSVSESVNNSITSQLLNLIDKEKPELASILLKYNKEKLESIDINETVAYWNTHKISILTYSFLKGSFIVFKDLIEIGTAKTYVMENQLKQMGTDALEVICTNGFLQILRYYFPRYLKHKVIRNKTGMNNLTSIQTACKYAHINIIKFFLKYYQNKLPPNDLNIHYVNEQTGINCANISLMEGNLNMANFLFYNCHVNFHAIPRYFKDHFQFVYFYNSNNLAAFIQVSRFLIDIVCIDLTEDTLSLDVPEEIKNYFKLIMQKSENTLNVSSIRFEQDSTLYNLSML